MKNPSLNKIYRDVYGKLVASLISYFGLQQITLAEDIVQDTFLAAAERWQDQMPKDPEAWLFKVCKNKAINVLKKQSIQNTQSYASYGSDWKEGTYQLHQRFLPHEIRDHTLRVILALCHPDLPERTQVILVLRIIIGFKIEEIAGGFGLSSEAVKKILVRGKKQIRDRRIPLHTPFVFKSRARLNSVHKVLYLIFNEGYNATGGAHYIKQELCAEALKLTQILIDEQVYNSSTHALLALMLFNIARFSSRQTAQGGIIDLESQDRSVWDAELIRLGFFFLKKSRAQTILSKYHLEAGIAAVHCSAKSFEHTNWCLILKYYDQLYEMNKSPFVWLNRCIALSYCEYPAKAIKALLNPEIEEAFKSYYLYFITMGKLYLRANTFEKAKVYFNKGLQLTTLEVEKQYIDHLIKNMPNI